MKVYLVYEESGWDDHILIGIHYNRTSALAYLQSKPKRIRDNLVVEEWNVIDYPTVSQSSSGVPGDE